MAKKDIIKKDTQNTKKQTTTKRNKARNEVNIQYKLKYLKNWRKTNQETPNEPKEVKINTMKSKTGADGHKGTKRQKTTISG